MAEMYSSKTVQIMQLVNDMYSNKQGTRITAVIICCDQTYGNVRKIWYLAAV